MQLKEATASLHDVAAADLTSLTDGEVTELVLDAQRHQALADAVLTAAVARLDVTRVYEADGARSAAAWLGWKAHLSGASAHAVVQCGRALRSMPQVGAAFLDGSLTSDHVQLLAACQRTAPDEFARQEEFLLGLTERLRFRQLEKALRYWRHLAAPDHAEDEAVGRYRRRHAHCSETYEAMVAIDAMLDPVGGAIYARELRRLEDALFEADWAEARARLGDAASVADLCRTAPQRRADAMVEMARRSAAKEPGAREARTLLSVLVGEQTLEHICELSNGTVLTPGEVLPLLAHADVERVVFDGPSRVLDVGVRQRLFTGATRRAIELRDRECVHESCEVPAERCHGDHKLSYDDDGPTVQSNGQCLCRFHHRWRHRQPGPPS